MIFFMDIHAQRAVIAFHAGGPGRCGSGGVGDIIRLAGFLIQRIMGVLAGQRQRVNAFKEAARPFCIISRGGDFRIAHSVANQQNNIFSRFID